jgi:glyoxylase-like metal-dependent hydrolase (beta-lactamase superfamily II)
MGCVMNADALFVVVPPVAKALSRGRSRGSATVLMPDRPALAHGLTTTSAWDAVHASGSPDRDLAEGVEFVAAGTVQRALHTLGTHRGAPACRSDLGTVFTGDTVLWGGPGATGRSSGDRPPISPRSARRRSLCPTTSW